MLTAIPAVVIGIISIVRIGRSGGRLKGRAIAAAGVVFSVLWMVMVCLLWTVDAPPIPNDYTVADLRSAPAEHAESFEILNILIDEELDLPGAPAVGLTEEDLDMSVEIRTVIQEGTAAEVSETLQYYAKDVERAWANMKGTRDVIKRLDAFAEIADLTEPSALVKIMRVKNLLELARFYQVYAHLRIEQRDVQVFTAELVELDSVLRKLSVNARMIVTRLVCLWCLQEDIVTANAIVNDPRTPMSVVELLAEHFAPVTDDQISLRNGVLMEYLLLKSAISKASGSTALGKTRLLKPNSTLRFLKNSCDDWLNARHLSGGAATTRLSVWPDFYPFDEPDPVQERAVLSFVYRCYNPLGSRCTSVRGFSRIAGQERGTNISVQDDLLQIVLNKRLGKEVSLKARAYGDEYIVDVEGGRIFSPGPDGKAGTKDDIALPIKPEVLGW